MKIGQGVRQGDVIATLNAQDGSGRPPVTTKYDGVVSALSKDPQAYAAEGMLIARIKVTPLAPRPAPTVLDTIVQSTPASFAYDVFISHASEDKAGFVQPLADALRAAGLRAWYDKFELEWGRSLRESIDKGLANSRFGLVVLSHWFFAKEWPQRELNGLFATMKSGERRILPVWHELEAAELQRYWPLMSDYLALRSRDGIEAIVSQVVAVCATGKS